MSYQVFKPWLPVKELNLTNSFIGINVISTFILKDTLTKDLPRIYFINSKNKKVFIKWNRFKIDDKNYKDFWKYVLSEKLKDNVTYYYNNFSVSFKDNFFVEGEFFKRDNMIHEIKRTEFVLCQK